MHFCRCTSAQNEIVRSVLYMYFNYFHGQLLSGSPYPSALAVFILALLRDGFDIFQYKQDFVQ